MLMMDLDGTVWDHLNITGVDPPYRVEGGVLVSENGTRIRPYQDAIEFIRWCRSNGAITCTLSWNRFDYVEEALKKLGIWELFDLHATEYTPDKAGRLRRVLDGLAGGGLVIPPERVVYVDDRDIHMEEIRRQVGEVIFIHIWKVIRDYAEARRIVEDKVLGTPAAREGPAGQ
ncbi:magnesium-dependent phosphatase-1 [Thermogymnomonas acidicola]|uniref:Magnesium-dependent phosphatase-1 n=1 Tax=Thermogymnomonas acidicola TaxID=399579 RepID=A0AA37F8Y1_9ARCH|nr:magnesium-dependent phosphatase-1 [Thermogymnomonas acidicola]